MHFSVVFELDGISCTVNSYKVEVYLLLPLSFFHIVLLVRLLVFICLFFEHVFVVSGFILTAICVLYVLIGMKVKRSRFQKGCVEALSGFSSDLQRRVFDIVAELSSKWS